MYWMSPFHYLLEGLLGLVTHNIPITCTESELARFAAPAGQTCESYAGPYAAQAGGYVTTLSGGLCGFCQYANGDEFAASFNVYYKVSRSWCDDLSLRITDMILYRTSGETMASSGPFVYLIWVWCSLLAGCTCRVGGLSRVFSALLREKRARRRSRGRPRRRRGIGRRDNVTGWWLPLGSLLG